MLFALSGCGASDGRNEGHSPASTSTSTSASVVRNGPAFGLTEDNADLLWNPSVAAPTGGASFRTARAGLTALHPTYMRLLIDWAALQPRAGESPTLAAAVDGCARSVGPCGPYGGLRAELAAIASQQRGAPGSFQVVLDIFGAPPWAALSARGCELAGTTPFARPLQPDAIAAYRKLIASLLALGASVGVPLEWWSPWNEPNDPRFISPQRAACGEQTALSPTVYAQLARAMFSELRAHGGTHHEILGELNDLQFDSPHTTSVGDFVAALPRDVLCLGTVWSIHDYAARPRSGPAPDGVSALERALEVRGGCATLAPIWVTESGAGAPHPGRPRPVGSTDERAGCEALAIQLQRWYRDPRVAVVFQYSFREDPAFPVGLLSADLGHVYPSYGLWRAYVRARVRGASPPTPARGCA